MSESSRPPPYPGNTGLVRNVLGESELEKGKSSGSDRSIRSLNMDGSTSESRDDYRPYDDEEWEMDDAQEALRAHQHRGSAQHEHDLLHTSVLAYARPSPPASTAQLPYPVIIPQRRPKNRDRGFIRAYAPDLMRCGIDQRTFMDFLDGFNKATATSPWLSVIDLAGNAVGLIPYAIAAPIGLAVQIAAGVYKETQGRKHQNDFIVRMNEELFRPRGLYCLIMAYRPDSGKNSTRQGTVTQLDINATGTQANRNNRYRSNDGTMGPIEFPASAELIFPDLENASRDDKEGEGSIGDTVLKAFERFNDRRDLKSQRKYLKKNPTSALSPLMDPKVELTPKDREKQERRLEKNERKQEKHERKREKRAQKHPERVEKGSRKRLLQKDVLYMMIINMPTTDKMENAFQLVGDGKGTSGEDIDTREL